MSDPAPPLHTQQPTTRFSDRVADYVAHRPSYPGEAIDAVLAGLAAPSTLVAADIGAGTGISSRLLAQRGVRVLAVEPNAAMRSGAEVHARVQFVDGSAERTTLENGSCDLVVCAQAFHWFATREALAEIRRVLRPGGMLGLVWNERDESVDWVEALTHIVAPHEGDTPRFRKGTWRAPFDGTLFAMPEETVIAHAHAGGAQEVVVDRFLSVSFIAALPDDERAGVERQLRKLIETHPALHGRETISFPYRTRAFRCVRG